LELFELKMGRMLLIITVVFFLSGCARNEEQKRAWGHFWGFTEKGPGWQNQIIKKQGYKTFTSISKNSPDIITADGIKYKLQKKPLDGTYGETQFEFVIR